MREPRISVHYQIFMSGRGWTSIWCVGTRHQRETWIRRQRRIREVIQVKECEGCDECID